MEIKSEKQGIKFDKQRIVALREQLGLSKRKFAKTLTESGGKQVHRQSIIQWEGGQCAPNMKTIELICNTFDVNIDYFFV